MRQPIVELCPPAIIGGQILTTTSKFDFLQRSGRGCQNATDWKIGPGDQDAGTGLSGAMAKLSKGKRIGRPGGIANSDTNAPSTTQRN